MKPFKPLTLFLILGTGIIFSAFNGPAGSKYPTGAPAGYTNSPGDGKNCSFCHGGTVTPVTGWITSDIPADGYTPGTTYTITVTATGNAGVNKGFEISPQDLAGNLQGTLMAGTGNQLVGSGKYVTHDPALTGANASWSFQWTAPVNGTGDVTFYASVVVGKPNINTTTYQVSENNVGIHEKDPISFQVYPNPTEGIININTSRFLEENTIYLTDLSGKSVQTIYHGSLDPSLPNLQLNLQKTAGPGLYLLEVVNQYGRYTKKVVLQ